MQGDETPASTATSHVQAAHPWHTRCSPRACKAFTPGTTRCIPMAMKVHQRCRDRATTRYHWAGRYFTLWGIVQEAPGIGCKLSGGAVDVSSIEDK
eukprot:1142353-Pelagomonas_calceolata.AAC.2